jgi:hypothetical protein
MYSMSNKTLNESGDLLDREPRELAPHIARNAELVDATVAGVHGSLARRVFPSDLTRTVRSHEMMQLKTGFEYRRRALQMAVETKLQTVEEMCNHLLVTGKSEIRRERQEFFAAQSLKLQTAMDDCAQTFNQKWEASFERLEKLRNEHLRSREEERLLRSVDTFHAMLDELVTEFAGIIHEGVQR